MPQVQRYSGFLLCLSIDRAYIYCWSWVGAQADPTRSNKLEIGGKQFLGVGIVRNYLEKKMISLSLNLSQKLSDSLSLFFWKERQRELKFYAIEWSGSWFDYDSIHNLRWKFELWNFFYWILDFSKGTMKIFNIYR